MNYIIVAKTFIKKKQQKKSCINTGKSIEHSLFYLT